MSLLVDVDVALAVVCGLGVLMVLASRAVRFLPLTEPLVALVLGVVIGPELLGLAEIDNGFAILGPVSEVVMAVALMAVALRFPWARVAEIRRPVAWLLTVGMLGAAASVALLAGWLLGLGAGAAVLAGGVLAPTDPVLSSSIVTGDAAEESLPHRLRALLSVESGFNDGLALPVVVAGIALVEGRGPGHFLFAGIASVAIAVIVGIVIGAAVGTAFRRLEETSEIEDSAFFVSTLVLALFTLGVVNLAHGDGILGVFVAGLAYNRVVGPSLYDQEREVEEGINRVLVLPAFILLGVLLPWAQWTELGWPVVTFAVAVLALRRLPVILALGPALGLGRVDTALHGWFGPMGVAALFYVTHAVEEGVDLPELWPAVALVVAASTVAHGVTAAPLRTLRSRHESGVNHRTGAPRG